MSSENDNAGKDKNEQLFDKNEKNADKPTVAFTPASFKQKIFTAMLLMITTVVLVFVWVYYLKLIETNLQQETKVVWEVPSQTSLRPGPPSFWYDRIGKTLVYKGIIDKQQKEELVALLKPEDNGVSKQSVSSYWAAIDKMAYLSRGTLYEFIQNLIILGGISGILGVQLRSLTNFVGNACFKNVLDMTRWWPWYVIRPFSGFLLGMVIVIIIQAGLFKPGETVPLSTLWWAGIALLAGFGADDFAQRLRLLTQTLFGQTK